MTSCKSAKEVLPGLSPNLFLKFITLYPNPTNSEIYYDTKSSVDFEFTILDAIGKALQKGTFTKDQAKINLSGYAKGVYYITVTSGDMKQTDRVILQ